MSALNGIKCHSAYRHYWMFHDDRNSSYGNSIFNTTNNFYGGEICGGGFLGGLFGGIGMGIGAGLVNLLCRNINLFSGCTFGNMGMFGGGMFSGIGMFGNMGMFTAGLSPFTCWWGGSTPSTKSGDGAGGVDNSSSNVETKNRHADKYAELNKRETDLVKNFTKDKLQKLYTDALAGKKECEEDKNHKDSDLTNYNSLIGRLLKLAEKHNLEDKDGKLVEKTEKKKPGLTDTEQRVESPAQTGNKQVQQESKTVVPTVEKKVTTESPISDNGNNKFTLKFGERKNKTKVIDSTIKGKLIGTKTTKNADGKNEISTYILDASAIDGQKFGLRYMVTKNKIDPKNPGKVTYNVKCISINHHNCKEYKNKSLYVNPNGVNYELIDGKLVNTGNDFVVSTEAHDGYTKLDYKSELNEATDFDMPKDLDENGTYEETTESNDDGITIKENV